MICRTVNFSFSLHSLITQSTSKVTLRLTMRALLECYLTNIGILAFSTKMALDNKSQGEYGFQMKKAQQTITHTIRIYETGGQPLQNYYFKAASTFSFPATTEGFSTPAQGQRNQGLPAGSQCSPVYLIYTVHLPFWNAYNVSHLHVQ